jgi:hypothetical protein
MAFHHADLICQSGTFRTDMTLKDLGIVYR